MQKITTIFMLFITLIVNTITIYGTTDSTNAKNNTDLPKSYFEKGAKFGENSSVAKVLSTNKGVNVKFINPYTNSQINVFAGTFKGEINSQTDINFYCIDISHNLVYWTASQPHTYVDAGNTPSQMTYILNNYYPYKSLPYAGALTETKEAAAVQIALWYFADGIDVNTVDVADVKARALQIIADANANSGTIQPVATLLITPASTEKFVGEDVTMRVYAYNETGVTLSNVNVSLSTTSGTLSAVTGTTNASGYFEFTLSQGASLTAQVTASASVVVPQGTRYVHSVSPNSYQKLVLATPAMANRIFTADVRWKERADLRLTKTVDNANPTNGDVITFTISVYNDGPSNATGVEVTDIIDPAFEVQSVSASQGSFNPATGIWTVGTVNNGASANLVLVCKVNVINVFTTTINLGVAKDFNVFVIQDINQPSSDTQGKMAAGRDIFLSNYSVGDLLSAGNGTEDVLIAGRNLTYLTGAVYGGNVVYGNNSNLPVDYVSITGGTVRKDSVIDFAAANSYLLGLSADLANYPANGVDTLEWSTLKLTGNHPVINIFNVDGADVSNSTGIVINVPSGSTVIVNVAGDSILFNGGLDLYGATTNTTLYNFYESTYLTINNIDVKGTLLAPKADVNFIDGQLNGQFIAKSLIGKAQFNLSPFIGNMQRVTELINVAEITSSNQLDPDSEVGNGITTEDDYAKVDISVNPNLSVGTGTVNADWEYVGTYNSTDIMWVITRDKDGNLIAGTFGGKIYRSVDEGLNWTVINEGMNVGYIWAIQVNSVGDIFVATERGIYKSVDNGATWNMFALQNTDVRALLLDEATNAIYAGVWGGGIYKSIDNGVNWVQKNNGIIFTAVNTLAKNNIGDIFAGTFGGGIYKSSDAAENWNQLNLGYDHVWSIGINSANEIFVATYGNGLYYSGDNGVTFVRQNAVNAEYIYAITIDGNKVFASAWNGGIYQYQSSVEVSWTQLGMVGFGISSMMVDKNVLYVGTADGKLYRNTNAVTSINEIGGINYSFSLEQNYPNPFNPSTIIKYSIAEPTVVRLTVFDILGREVATLVNTNQNAGRYQVIWNATDNFGRKISSGIYFYTIEAGKFTKTNKMILIK
jgi:choice-of-anchor A domain-containing protein/uncharacterized repeat protein (TIGR01451 family)/TQXA domain-containing protein